MPTFQVVVDYKPAYELMLSLTAFLERSLHKALDLGSGWVNQVRKRLPPDLPAELAGLQKENWMAPPLLVWQSPAHQDIPQFLHWVDGLTPADLYELIAPYCTDSVQTDLGAAKDRWLHQIGAWYDAYHKTIDPAITAGLAMDASARRDESKGLDPRTMVERATNGLNISDFPDLKLVVLTPQYHCLPHNLCDFYNGLIFCFYPANMPPPREGQPSTRLLRLTHSIADESRLRILNLLAAGPLSFTEIVGQIGLAKSTIHYHIALLRASGLIGVHVTAPKPGCPTVTIRYALRPGALEDLPPMLADYIGTTRAAKSPPSTPNP